MLKFNQGIDIVEEIGKVATAEAALSVLQEQLAEDHFKRIDRVKNSMALKN